MELADKLGLIESCKMGTLVQLIKQSGALRACLVVGRVVVLLLVVNNQS